MLAIIQEIGVIQSVIIALCVGFALGMFFVIICEAIANRHNNRRVSKRNILVRSRIYGFDD